MTHLCYTLEEAAGRLNLSETVLVRLSQYFKVPQSAYEEAGYLSFKGDLSFSDQDIEFFRQVRERLLAGESLEEVKARIRYENVSVPVQSVVRPPVEAAPASPLRPDVPKSPPKSPYNARPAAITAPLREVVDRAPFEEAARQSFDRYKQSHRHGLGRVFENMLREVGVSRQETKKPPLSVKPLKAKTAEPDDWEAPAPAVPPLPHSGQPPEEAEASRERDSLLPFRSLRKGRGQPKPSSMQPASHWQPPASATAGPSDPRLSRPSVPDKARPVAEPATQPDPAPVFSEQRLDQAWEEIVGQSVHQPRALNNRLKDAAAQIRERALLQNQVRQRPRPL